MPFINCKLNVSLTEEQENSIKTEFGKAISLIPGKSEDWLMVNIEPDCNLYFRGSKDTPTAMVSVMVYGKPNRAAYDKLTPKLNQILSSVAKIENMYVSYSETPNWGFNTFNF